MSGFISLADAKRQVRVEDADTSEDALIQSLIDAASAHIENVTGYVAPVRSDETFSFDCFGPELTLRLRPIDHDSVEVSYLDSAGDTQTFSDIRITLRNGLTRISPALNKSWPSHASLSGAITVTADVGFAEDAAECPATLKHATRLLVSHWFENREAVQAGISVAELPIGVAALLGPLRPRRI